MSSEPITVEPSDQGLSLLQFLKGRLSHSGKAIKRAIDANGCFVNGRVERFSSFRVNSGDMVLLALEKGRKKEKKEFPVLYKDETLIAYNKQPFVSCDQTHTLHRLDKETSGVLLTSDDDAYYNLFRKRKIEKVYLAIVEGKPNEMSGVIDMPIGIKKRYEGHKVMHVCADGKLAETKYRVIKQKGGLAVLMLFPTTGRTHQIRVHLKAIGLPILGDFDYNKSFSVVTPRMLLHAYQVKFVHPHKKKKVMIEAPLPEDMFPYIFSHEVTSFTSP